jgi:hypothetical protein
LPKYKEDLQKEIGDLHSAGLFIEEGMFLDLDGVTTYPFSPENIFLTECTRTISFFKTETETSKIVKLILVQQVRQDSLPWHRKIHKTFSW